MKKKRRFGFACCALMLAVFVMCAAGVSEAATGDVDNQDGIDLRDAVTAIQVCAGMSPTGLKPGITEANQITLADAIFALQVVSGIFVLPYNPGDMGIPDDYETTMISMSATFPDMVTQLPGSFDWGDKGVVTRAKDERSHPVSPADDQGRCGSCWAFAAAGAMESKILMLGGPEYDLSEQQQVSCNTEQYGCCGGYLNAALFWSNRGPLLETCTKYGDYGTTSCGCKTSSPYIHCSGVSCDNMSACPQLSYRTDKYYSVNAAYSNEVKISLTQDGPAPFRLDIYNDFFNFWNKISPGTVYKQSGGSFSGGHAVLLIGWDDGKQAWLCKNSWGETGGPNGDGTFWIAYSEHANDLRFGMTNFTIKNTAPPTTTSSTMTTVKPTTTSTSSTTTTTVKPPTTTTTVTPPTSTTTTTIPSGNTLVWDSGKWDEMTWN